MRPRWTTVGVAFVLAATLSAGVAQAAGYAAALAEPHRPPADLARDAARKPAELLTFSGVKPDDKVADLIPGGGYFTRLFSVAVGPRGRVYAIWPAPYAAEAKPDPEKLEALSKTQPYTNVSVLFQPAARFSAPEALDLVFTSQNYHDYPDKFMGSLDPAVLNRAVFKALKPGGVFVIVDHAAQAGSGLRDTDTLHRIDPAAVKAEVTAAGFVFDGESKVLRNPADDHTKLVFDKSIRGHTDQFAYRFHKPAR